MQTLGIAAATLLAGASTAQAQRMPNPNPLPPTSPSTPQVAQPSARTSERTSSSEETRSRSTGHSQVDEKELTGKVASVDRQHRSLTIDSASGAKQNVKLADGATITRDGVNVGLEQLRRGDEVRASFNPGHEAATLEVHSTRSSRR
jgi:cytoskeletal protein RodZ